MANTRFRKIKAGLLAVMLGLLAPAVSAQAETAGWPLYKARFVTAEGRVVDSGNADVSHTEGQGWGLLLAVANDDRETFERIRTWTRAQLGVRPDRLFAWRWRPDRPADPIPDRNNASDGDIYIAWALLRAAEKWQVPAWRDEALGILDDLRRCCVIEQAGRRVLLPGADGFERKDHIVVNLSYWVFPALRAFAAADPNGGWDALAESGRALLQQARFGRWGLPADWTRIGDDGQAHLPEDFPPRFSWDAIRVPLLLAWGGVDDPALYQPFAAFAGSFADLPLQPAWTNLDDDSIASEPRNAAFDAVFALATWRAEGAGGPVPTVPGLDETQDYYTSSLLLLTRLALAEGGRQ